MGSENLAAAVASRRYEQCLICNCNAGAFRVFTSNSMKNPGRQYYKCPISKCKFFKWVEDVRDNELINVPYCGGCNAGLCRVFKETSGENAGKIFFTCRIKEGQGSCGYKVYRDEVLMSAVQHHVHSNLTSPPAASTDNNDAGPANIQLVKESLASEIIIPDKDSPLTTTPQNLRTCGEASRKTKRSRCQDDETDESSVNSGSSATLNWNLLEAETSEVSPTPKAFKLAAELLQDDLVTCLEKMKLKEHKTMSQSAEITFAALDRLLIDYGNFKKRVNELISCARSLDKMEKSMPGNDLHQNLVDRERTKLDEINSSYATAVNTVTGERERLKIMRTKIACTKDWLFQAEADLLCFEVELGTMENQLERISKDKEVLEGKYAAALKEMGDLVRLRRQRDEAKAEFDRARALLRG